MQPPSLRRLRAAPFVLLALVAGGACFDASGNNGSGTDGGIIIDVDGGIGDAGACVSSCDPDAGDCDGAVICDASVSGDGGACTPETDTELCEKQQTTCGQIAVIDSCGQERTPTCDVCPTGATCGADNLCTCETGYSDNGVGCDVSVGTSCATIGSVIGCPDSMAGVQQTCEAYEGVDICSVECAGDTDCGTNGTIQNSCVSIGLVKLCVPRCDPSQANPCGNDELVCSPAVGAGGAVCVPSCRLEPVGWCASQIYGGVCDPPSGQCVTEACAPDGTCPVGELCYTAEGFAEPTCVPDCNNVSFTCPASTTCQASGFCG